MSRQVAHKELYHGRQFIESMSDESWFLLAPQEGETMGRPLGNLLAVELPRVNAQGDAGQTSIVDDNSFIVNEVVDFKMDKPGMVKTPYHAR